MPDPSEIERFVRQTLGCTCPDEVFRSIDVREKVSLNSFLTLHAAIIVGNRLLIYIADAGTVGCIEEHLPVLLAAGRKERDEKGLNRFRLVLVADEPESIQRIAEQQFGELRGKDEKLHLHVIRGKDNPFATESAT